MPIRRVPAVPEPTAGDTAFERHVLPEIDVLLRVANSLTRNHAETARILDVPVGTVMSRLHRTRTRIRDRLDQAGLASRSSL